jgi:secreted Zn-dependent insulinase-like peptidase
MSSARNSAFSDLFTEVVEDRLNAYAYPAYLAGLGYEVYPHLRGFSVRISGFSDRQSTLLARIVESLRSTGFDPARFERLRSNAVEDYRNRLLESPARLAMSELQRLLIEDAWPLEDRIEALEQASLEEFREFVQAFFKAGNSLALSVGNLTDAEAGAMGKILQEQLMAGVQPVDVPRSKVVRLETERNYERVIDSDHQDSVVGLYKQGRDDSYRERALFYLYDQLSDTDFYNELRTEKKLGYIVQSFAMPIVNVPGMMYLVQSPTTSAEDTEAAIRGFIAKFGERVAETDDATLTGARDALLSRINQRDDALSDRADRYWRELDDEEYDFDSRQQLSDALKSISLEDLTGFASRLSGASTSSLVIKSFGGQLPASDSSTSRLSRLEIADYATFKEDHAAF